MIGMPSIVSHFPEPTLLDRDMLDGPSALKALFLLCSLPSFHRSARF
jgi:hypothetical protein